MLRFLLPLILLFFICSCKNDIETIKLVAAEKNAPSQTSNDIVLTYSDSAKVKVKLTSPRIEHFQTDSLYDLFPKGVHVDFFDDSMKVQSQLTSKFAIRFENRNRLEAKNDVVVFNKKGEKLNTELLIWDGQKHTIYTNTFVKITTRDQIIYGDGLESNEDFSKYKIKNIKGTINLKKEEIK